jgi:hypothetical protein
MSREESKCFRKKKNWNFFFNSWKNSWKLWKFLEILTFLSSRPNASNKSWKEITAQIFNVVSEMFEFLIFKLKSILTIYVTVGPKC